MPVYTHAKRWILYQGNSAKAENCLVKMELTQQRTGHGDAATRGRGDMEQRLFDRPTF
jgi:hypothetical protein